MSKKLEALEQALSKKRGDGHEAPPPPSLKTSAEGGGIRRVTISLYVEDIERITRIIGLAASKGERFNQSLAIRKALETLEAKLIK